MDTYILRKVIILAKNFTPLVPDVFEGFMKLKKDPNVHAVYFKRSEESGKVVYPSFVTRSDDIKRMKAFIRLMGSIVQTTVQLIGLL